MERKSLRKLLALSSFFLLISLFVLFKSGSLGQFLSAGMQTSPNGGAVNTIKADSTAKAKEDSVSRLRMSSSKMLVIVDNRTAKKAKKQAHADSVARAKRMRMPGSKSAMILDPSVLNNADTLTKRDTAVIKQQP